MIAEKINIESSVNEVLKVYEASMADMKFLVDSKNRLEDLKARIHSNQVRVAVIGITSSGKSTLLNTILGQKLLPTRVAPSSGKQVLCGYGKDFQADILFEEETGKNTLTVRNDIKKIQTVLDQYGDEKFNPRNKHGVREIHVFSPSFKFNHDLVFVDTPGLDAYGLGIHEEITLKMVLPTVDMIMFLTNVKCDSDQQNLEFIDRATSDVKPLVVVQNKIDSIEPKITKNGVEKTKEDIRKEHYLRLEKLLALAKKKSVKEAPIVQISAKAATWEKTNLKSLSAVLDQQISVNTAHRYYRFENQFLREIESMEDILSKVLKDVSQKESESLAQKQTLTTWEQHAVDIKNALNMVHNEITDKITGVSRICAELLSTIDSEYKKGSGYINPEVISSSVTSKKRNLETEISRISAFFNNSISEIQKLIAVSCNDLNLQESQISRKEIFGQVNVSISNAQRVVKGAYHKQTTRLVPRDTIGGGIKRFFGTIFGQDDWGYDEVVVPAYYDPDKTIYDIPVLIQEIKKGYAQFKSFFSQKYPVFQQNTEFSINFIEQELLRKKNEIECIFQAVLPMRTAGNVLTILRKYINPNRPQDDMQTHSVANVKRVEQTGLSREDYQAREVDKLTYDLFQHAQYHALDVHRSLIKSMIQESYLQDVCVAGWDPERTVEFKGLFFPEDLKVRIIDFSIPKINLPNSKTLLFLLINAEQPGSMKNRLFNSPGYTDWLKKVVSAGKIVWVMDSVRALICEENPNEDHLVEAFFEMRKMIEAFYKNTSGNAFDVMACDRELYYSVLLHELFYNDKIGRTEKDRQDFVHEMSTVFALSNERLHITGKYLNDYLLIRKENNPNA